MPGEARKGHPRAQQHIALHRVERGPLIEGGPLPCGPRPSHIARHRRIDCQENWCPDSSHTKAEVFQRPVKSFPDTSIVVGSSSTACEADPCSGMDFRATASALN